jgi:hypothetical protein
MMIKQISRIATASALVLAAMGTTTLRADIVDDIDPAVTASTTENAVSVRIMNNHGDRVFVYVVDEDRLYLLGTVGHGQLKTFEVPEAWVKGASTVQLKVYPRALEGGIGRSAFDQSGIRTRAIEVPSDRMIELLLEPNLSRSDLNIVPA